MLTRDKKLLLLIAVISTSFIISWQIAEAQNQTKQMSILKECEQFNTKHIYTVIRPGYSLDDVDIKNVICLSQTILTDHGWRIAGYITTTDQSSLLGLIYDKPDMEIVP